RWPRDWSSDVCSSDLGVPIRDPTLAIRADTGKVVVLATTPDRVGMAQEERRRIRPAREVDVQIRLLDTQVGDQRKHRAEIGIERAAWNRVRHIPRAVELELIDAIPPDHVETGLAKPREVLGTRKREATLVRLEPLRSAEGQPVLLGLPIPAPGRHPDAGGRAVPRRRLAQQREAAREAGMKPPQRVGIVPAVVEQKRIEVHTARLVQLAADRTDGVERRRLVELGEVADVVPRVVMKEGAVRMGTLTLEIGEEIAPQLSGRYGAHDR